MNIVFVASFIAGLFFSVLFAFPRHVLAKLGYKNVSHPDDYDFEDTIFFRVIVGVLMILAWGLSFYALSTLG